jgi:DNA-binding protein HU-beta
MNKAQLVAVIQKDMGKEISNATAKRALDAVLRSIRRGGRVELVGFGTFRVSQFRARRGRNPKTGAPIQIKASKTVRFSAGKGLKESL